MQAPFFGHSQKSPPPSKIDPGFKYKSQETSFHQKLPSSLFWHRIDVSTPSKVTVHDIEDSLESSMQTLVEIHSVSDEMQ